MSTAAWNYLQEYRRWMCSILGEAAVTAEAPVWVGWRRGDNPAATDRAEGLPELPNRGRRVTPRGIHDIIRRRLKTGLHVPGQSVHRLRATTATQALRAGISVDAVADLLDHESVGTTSSTKPPSRRGSSGWLLRFRDRRQRLRVILSRCNTP